MPTVFSHTLFSFFHTHAGRPGGLVVAPECYEVLVHEFESPRGEILNLFAKKKKKGSTAESA